MKLKRGGAYVDASPFIKRGGVYGAVSALVKSGGGYVSAGGSVEPSGPFEITNVTGTIAHGQTITVTGSGLGQSPTLLRIRGDEGPAGTSVATATGMTVHGSTGNEWLFEAGGTMVLDMQSAAPKTVYKWLGGTAYKEAFLYYERQHFDVGALNPEGKGQVKEARFAGADVAGQHTDDPALGTVWDVETSILYRFCGYAGQLNLAGATRSIMTAWSSQMVAGRIVGSNAVGDYEIYGDNFTSRLLGDTATAPDTKGYGQIFLPFFRSPDFSTSMRMRNFIARAGRQRLEVRNSANPATANRVVVLHANDGDITPTEMLVKLDLARFSVNDGLYLFAVNANGEYSAAYELRQEAAPDTYNPLTDDFGVLRPTHNGVNGILTVPDYSVAAAAADSLRFQFGFVVDGLDSFASGTPINIGISRSSADQYRGNIRIDKTTGAIIVRSMVNNAALTLAATSDVHSNLGVRRDWELVIPKNTGELITLTDMQAASLIGSVARTATFDGFWPTWWMYANGNTEGALKGRVAYLRCFATTGGVETTVFDFRFTAEQSGLTSVPSAHDAGVIATIGASLTWGAA